MKSLILILVSMMLLVTAVSATNGVLDQETVTMDYQDVRVVSYCIYEDGNPVTNFPVTIDPVCRELDNVLGCSAGDEFNPAGFSAVPAAPTTGADGCVDIILTTDLDQNKGGTFIYNANGDNGYGYVASETGTVLVPEFGVLAASLVLLGAGLFIYKRRN